MHSYAQLIEAGPRVVASLVNGYNVIRWSKQPLSVELLQNLFARIDKPDFILVGKDVAKLLRSGKSALSEANFVDGCVAGTRGAQPDWAVCTLMGRIVVTYPEVPSELIAFIKDEPDELIGIKHVGSWILCKG